MYHRKYAHPTYVRAHTKNTPVYKGQKSACHMVAFMEKFQPQELLGMWLMHTSIIVQEKDAWLEPPNMHLYSLYFVGNTLCLVFSIHIRWYTVAVYVCVQFCRGEGGGKLGRLRHRGVQWRTHIWSETVTLLERGPLYPGLIPPSVAINTKLWKLWEWIFQSLVIDKLNMGQGVQLFIA